MKRWSTEKRLKLIYLALVESIITYGIIGRGCFYDNILIELQMSKNPVTRVVLKKKTSNENPL